LNEITALGGLFNDKIALFSKSISEHDKKIVENTAKIAENTAKIAENRSLIQNAHLQTTKELKDLNSKLDRLDHSSPLQNYWATNIPTFFPDSTILTENWQIILLNQWYGNPAQKWTKIYTAGPSQNYSEFHKSCDKSPQIMVIIKDSANNIFGGYSFNGFQSRQAYNQDLKAFLWTLVNPSGCEPRKFLNKGTSVANQIYDQSTYGPTFGAHDIVLYLNNTATCYSSIGHSYYLPPGYTATTILTGAHNFIVNTVEIYRANI